jgi:hypothetical protein
MCPAEPGPAPEDKMNWNKSRSVLLTRICIGLFAAVLLLIDVFGPKIVNWYLDIRQMQPRVTAAEFLLTLYSLSAAGWACLWSLWRLLANISGDVVFTEENIRLLRVISWLLAAAALICFVSGFYYLPFFIVSLAAAFMMLIVRVVKNCFRQALDMKSELDLTI